MLEKLFEAEKQLPDLLINSGDWNSAFIDYEKPFVERVWIQWNEYRINLHDINFCNDEVYFHPHPWPAAIKILENGYIMDVGFGSGIENRQLL